MVPVAVMVMAYSPLTLAHLRPYPSRLSILHRGFKQFHGSGERGGLRERIFRAFSEKDEYCEENNPILELQTAVTRVMEECPWALDQTPKSIVKYLISEVDEVREQLGLPIDLESKEVSNDFQPNPENDDQLEDELGDLLLNVLFLASIAKTHSRRGVSIQGAARRAVEKLYRRCPYIFGTEKVDTIEQARAIWQRVKKEEEEARSKS
ncbi:hypothetical protein AAMO2058_000549600 [Amorphochlora amoebiformis]